MEQCCEKKGDDLAQLKERHSKVLYAVLWVNAAMFLVEFTSGWIARSTALLGDSLDMLGDASVYALTLYVIDKGVRAQAKTSLVKGYIMLLLGLIVVVEAAHKVLHGAITPHSEIMGWIAALALVANGICFLMLYRHRSDNLNMSSVWLCSRNDLIANVAVLVAAGLVAWTGALWPDLVVGLGIAGLFVHSAQKVIRSAKAELKEQK